MREEIGPFRFVDENMEGQRGYITCLKFIANKWASLGIKVKSDLSLVSGSNHKTFLFETWDSLKDFNTFICIWNLLEKGGIESIFQACFRKPFFPLKLS